MRTAMRWMLAMCVAGLVAGGLSACGDKGGSGGGGGASSPVGAWQFDVDELVKQSLAQMPEEQRKMMNDTMLKGMKEMMSKMDIEVVFKADGKTTMKSSGIPNQADETGEGTWTLDGTKLTVKTTMKNGKPATGEDAKTMDAEFKNGVISMKPEGPNAPTIVLMRM